MSKQVCTGKLLDCPKVTTTHAAV